MKLLFAALVEFGEHQKHRFSVHPPQQFRSRGLLHIIVHSFLCAILCNRAVPQNVGGGWQQKKHFGSVFRLASFFVASFAPALPARVVRVSRARVGSRARAQAWLHMTPNNALHPTFLPLRGRNAAELGR